MCLLARVHTSARRKSYKGIYKNKQLHLSVIIDCSCVRGEYENFRKPLLPAVQRAVNP